MKRADIALVRGPDPRRGPAAMPLPPLGMLYVAASLQAAGHRVAVIDADAEGLDQADFLHRVRMVGAPVIGLSGMTPMRELIAADINRVRPLCDRLVLGGVHATRFRERALDEFPELDALVIGEGEQVACELLDWWGGGAKGAPPAGVMVPGQPFTGASPPAELDVLPWPARHLVPHGRYRYIFQTHPIFTTLITSRGCPFRCTFCDKTVSGSRWRARSAGDVVEEIAAVQRDLGVGSLCIFDDNFTLKRSRVVAICEELIRRGIRIDWKAEARVDGIDRELAKLMHSAGCKTLAFGIESGNQQSLDTLQKGQTVTDAQTAIAACRQAGIETVAYVLVGIPGETPQSSMNTLDFARKSQVDFIQFSTLSPFEGTALYDQALAENWLVRSSVTNPVDAEEHRATLLPPDWTERDLDRTLRRLYAGFYLRPGYLMRQVGRAARNGQLRPRVKMGAQVARWCLRSRSPVGRVPSSSPVPTGG